MEKVHDTVAWYQQKIGSYDKQLWEQSVEQKVLKSIQQAPRRSVRPKTGLIDVDLVRGSTFTKAKPQVPWTYITFKTISRVLLFPFHYKWWLQQMSFRFWLCLMVLYILQIFTIVVFFRNVGDDITQDEMSLSEVAIPCVVMMLIGLIHSQTVLTHFSLKPPVRDNKRDGWRRNRSLSQRGSMTAVDGAVNSGTDAVNSSNQSKPRHVTKGHTSSRSTRERTKERKPRTKTNLNNARQQLPVRRADAVLAHPQDSESAYNTHEASDSYFDPTSSHDHDSNGHGNEKKCDLLNIQQVVKNKLRESQESDLPESQGSNSENESKVKLRDKCLKTGYEPGNKEKRISQSISSDDEDTPVGNGGQVKSYSATVTPAVSGVQVKIDSPVGMTVSQTGESEGCKGTCLKKVEIESKPGESEGCELTCLKKIEIVGRTGKSEGCETTSLNTVETVNQARESEGCKITGLESIASQSLASSEQLKKLQFKSEFEGVSKFEHEHGHSKGCVNEVNQKRGKKGTADTAHSIIKESHVSEGVDVESSFADISVDSSTLKAIENLESTSNESLLSGSTVTHSCISDQNVDSLADDITKKIKGLRNRKHPAVHFIPGSELVREREITPLCSRDSTPTHTQSEIVLPASNAAAKRLRRVTAHSKSESDTETDEEGGSYQQKTLRRRKGRGQDTKESGSGRSSLLPPSTCRKSSTAASSSEGETEAQASECGRRSVVSSEDWEDRIQSEDSSTYSSSCGTDPEISANDEIHERTESDSQGNLQQGMTQSNIHVINILHPSTSQSLSTGTQDKVTCIIWELNECKKVELTAMDIGWAIIDTVDKIPESSDYILIGLAFSIIMGLTPVLFHAFHTKDLPNILIWENILELVSATPWRQTLIVSNAIIQRCCLSALFFFLLSVADRTFKQAVGCENVMLYRHSRHLSSALISRLLYAKHFCYLTSSRRARKFDMPHFRLNKVRNIKTWLSLRSYLKKRGPQRSVDVIVSSSFLICLIMLILMCLQLLRDAEIYLDYLCNWELLVWCMALGVYLLRFMTLGLRINKKYRNLSVLITEQINLYLQMEQKPHKKEELMVANNVLKLAECLLKMEQKPHKKEELMVANNVLKLAECLLKELESPFKISGISANPFVLNVTKVVILSAFSAVLTELLGFKLKLYKIKLKA